MSISKSLIQKLLASAGVRENGSQAEDILVNDSRFYRRVLSRGTLGAGESYMEGWWDCEDIDVLVSKMQDSGAKKWLGLSPFFLLRFLKNLTENRAIAKNYEIGEVHYDVGNLLFEKMLGPTMAYSCGYWKEAKSLDEAQVAKFDIICRKLDLKPGQKLLDIGCGWGSFLKYAIENCGVRGVGITVSKRQAEWASDSLKGLPAEIRVQDYNELNEKFDHIASVGMFEHVGHKNYKKFILKTPQMLNSGGKFLLHTIGKEEFAPSVDPWISKYIFPNSEIPIKKDVKRAIQSCYNVWDWQEFGKYYDLTLMRWYENFERAWPELMAEYAQKVSGRFYRMWRFYLLSSAGIFRAGKLKLWQILLSKDNKPPAYQKIR